MVPTLRIGRRRIRLFAIDAPECSSLTQMRWEIARALALD